jgi:hypothetical protein
MIPLEGVYAYTTRRQELPEAFHPDGAVIAMLRDVLMDSEDQPPPAYLGNDRRAVVQSQLDGIELESADDLALLEAVLSLRSGTR